MAYTSISGAPSESFWSKAARQELGFVSTPAKKPHRVYVSRIPGVYPYSVVPGGVQSADSLKNAVASDQAVSRHYAHFDYNHAHLFRLEQARDVYVSYRIRDSIFWTQKRIHLQAGELLLTDGKIMARAKCGNQISDTAKPDISNEEPDESVLEEPVALEPIGPALSLRTALGAPELPAGQPVAPKLFAGGFDFPYVPFNLPLPPRNCEFVTEVNQKDCSHKHPKRPIAPEPSTMILLGSGLALLGFLGRGKKHSPLA